MPELKQELTGFDMTMVAIGSTIGAGIFLTPAVVAKSLPAAPWILLVWVVGGFVAVTGALTFAELGAMMPRAGGIYVFLTEAFGGRGRPTSAVVTVAGTNLTAIPSLRLRSASYTYHLIGEQWLSSTQMTGYVSYLQVPPGLYDLVLENPDGQEAVLPAAVTIGP